VADEEDQKVMRMLGARVSFRIVALAAVLLIGAVSLARPFTFAQAQADGLVGDYTVTLVREDVPQDIANGETVIGRWRLSFKDDGSYEAERLDLGVLVQGTYSVDGDKLTVTDESGLLSCSNPAMSTADVGDVSVGTYHFKMRSNSLTFTPDQEGCAVRRILFSTKEFAPFVACNTTAMTLEAAGANATPLAKLPSPSDVLVAEATPGSGQPPSAPTASASTDEQIDALVGQLTACWATGDPARFLPLWSEAFRKQFLTGSDAEQATALNSLRAAMQVPVSWERAGDVKMTGKDQAEAVVRTRTLDQEEFVRYRFVLENGEWRWDGAAS
jgi:hypothetical protein